MKSALQARRDRRAKALRYGRHILQLEKEAASRFKIDPENVPTNRVLERWAVSIGSGLPTEPWDDSRKSEVDPLDDVTCIVVDRIVCLAPIPTKTIVRKWYCGHGSASVIARELQLSRSAVYLRWRAALGYMRERFQASGHHDLLSLLLLIVPD